MQYSKLFSLCLFFFLISCNSAKKNISNNKSDDSISYEKMYDSNSETYYYLTYIKNKDKNGKLLKLQIAQANAENGETVIDFAKRMNNPLLAMNATMGIKRLGPSRKQVSGIQIMDGSIFQDINSRNYTLGIKENNELEILNPELNASDILNLGIKNAITGFVPYIQNYKAVDDSILKRVGNNAAKNPRQVIAQFENNDLLIFSCGGRGIDGKGMTAKEVINVLKKQNVKLAFNLDGGGSVTTVIRGKQITKMIDGKGTRNRPRSNFLYIKENN